MERKFRRIITGHNANGKSIINFDDLLTKITVRSYFWMFPMVFSLGVILFSPVSHTFYITELFIAFMCSFNIFTTMSTCIYQYSTFKVTCSARKIVKAKKELADIRFLFYLSTNLNSLISATFKWSSSL